LKNRRVNRIMVAEGGVRPSLLLDPLPLSVADFTAEYFVCVRVKGKHFGEVLRFNDILLGV
jgi:hypothetical protein